MDKISGIVSGSPRVAATDMKSTPPLRPGVPAFGRPMGISTIREPSMLSTAEKVGIIREEMAEAKKHRNEAKINTEVAANQFFLRPEDALQTAGKIDPSDMGDAIEMVEPSEQGAESAQNVSKYSPRGSYIDVRV